MRAASAAVIWAGRMSPDVKGDLFPEPIMLV
jgi:hypothetical protein